MPITGTLAIIASASMAGVPLLNGFLSKEMFFAETVFIQSTPLGRTGACRSIATLAGIFSVAYSARFVFDVFFGPPCGADVPQQPHEPPHWMRVPVELLVLVCLVVGIAPAWSVGAVPRRRGAPVVGGALPAYSLAVWHGFNLPLLMSFVALAGGAALYLLQRRGRARGALEHTPLLHRFDGQRMFENLLARLSEAGRRSRRLLGTRRLQTQLLLLVARGAWPAPAPSLWLAPAAARHARAAALLADVRDDLADRRAPARVGAAWQAKFHRLAALMLASAAPAWSCCITYIWFSAPDLALTQLVVEAVTTVLILLGLRWLPMRTAKPQPARARLRPWGRRGRDLLIAIAAGGGMAALAWTRDDAAVPAEHLALLPRHARCPRAAAPTWST